MPQLELDAPLAATSGVRNRNRVTWKTYKLSENITREIAADRSLQEFRDFLRPTGKGL